MVDERRKGRIRTIILEVLSHQLEHELRDPRIGFMTLTGVEISADLSVAKVYYTVLGDDASRAECRQGLTSALGFMRRKVGEALDLRKTPELRFLYDHAVERGMALDRTLSDLNLEETDSAANEPAEDDPGSSSE